MHNIMKLISVALTISVLYPTTTFIVVTAQVQQELQLQSTFLSGGNRGYQIAAAAVPLVEGGSIANYKDYLLDNTRAEVVDQNDAEMFDAPHDDAYLKYMQNAGIDNGTQHGRNDENERYAAGMLPNDSALESFDKNGNNNIVTNSNVLPVHSPEDGQQGELDPREQEREEQPLHYPIGLRHHISNDALPNAAVPARALPSDDMMQPAEIDLLLQDMPFKNVQPAYNEILVPAQNEMPVPVGVDPLGLEVELLKGAEDELGDRSMGYDTIVRWFPFVQRFEKSAHHYTSAFGTSLALIIVSELGDKTFFIAALMAMRHNAFTVFAGAMSALGLMTVLSVVVGLTVPALLNRTYTHYASIFLFIYFGVKLAYEAFHMEVNSAMEGLEEVEAELDKKKDSPPTPARIKEQSARRAPSGKQQNDSSSARRSASATPPTGPSTIGTSDGTVDDSIKVGGDIELPNMPWSRNSTTTAEIACTSLQAHTICATAAGGEGEAVVVEDCGSNGAMDGDGFTVGSHTRSDSQVSKRIPGCIGGAALTATVTGGNNSRANNHSGNNVYLGGDHNVSSSNNHKSVLSVSTSGSSGKSIGTDCENDGTECDYKTSSADQKEKDDSVVLHLPAKSSVTTTAINVSRTHLKDRIESTLFLIVRGFFSPAFLQAFTLTFVAEWGDRSQVATVVLAASRNPVGVCLGALIGHFSCTALAVVGGRLLAGRISERVVTLIGSIFFTLFAVVGWIHGV